MVHAEFQNNTPIKSRIGVLLIFNEKVCSIKMASMGFCCLSFSQKIPLSRFIFLHQALIYS